MRRTLPLLGLVLVVLSGCGGESPCEQLSSTLRDATKELASCEPGTPQPTEAQLEEAFGAEACEERSKGLCTDEEGEKVVKAMECLMGYFTCDALQSESGPTLAQLAECTNGSKDGIGGVSDACVDAMMPSDVAQNAQVRKALRLGMAR